MKVIVTGATGFIGKNLIKKLLDSKYQPIILTRNIISAEKIFGNNVIYSSWEENSFSELIKYCTEDYAIINLAGENIGKGRWTKNRKKKIIESRIIAGKFISEIVSKAATKPMVVIQASATGYYDGYSGQLSDEGSPKGERFISDVVMKWEKSVESVKGEKTRFVIIRSGVVLGNGGGMLQNILIPFKYYFGGKIGSGKQWISWIHIDDETDAILFLLENKSISGTYNLTAPEPVQMNDFLKTLAKVIKRPYWLPLPGIIIRLIFGEMGKELILSGENVSGKKLILSGFEYKYKNIYPALKSIFADNFSG